MRNRRQVLKDVMFYYMNLSYDEPALIRGKGILVSLPDNGKEAFGHSLRVNKLPAGALVVWGLGLEFQLFGG